MHVRKGDTVLVISGNDKGKRGAIQSVLLDKNRVVVEGVNLRWKHKKASQKSPKGERVQRECPIHASNVMLVDPKSGEPTRRRGSVPDAASSPAAREQAGGAKDGTKVKP